MKVIRKVLYSLIELDSLPCIVLTVLLQGYCMLPVSLLHCFTHQILQHLLLSLSEQQGLRCWTTRKLSLQKHMQLCFEQIQAYYKYLILAHGGITVDLGPLCIAALLRFGVCRRQ